MCIIEWDILPPSEKHDIHKLRRSYVCFWPTGSSGSLWWDDLWSYILHYSEVWEVRQRERKMSRDGQGTSGVGERKQRQSWPWYGEINSMWCDNMSPRYGERGLGDQTEQQLRVSGSGASRLTGRMQGFNWAEKYGEPPEPLSLCEGIGVQKA